MQEEKGNKRAAENNEEKEEEKRPKQQFDKDYTLEPYEGVGPEFMEMSRSTGLLYTQQSLFPYDRLPNK